ncbi:MAG: hypothetical protein ACRENP_28870 [Longimicrobiales bacterium]
MTARYLRFACIALTLTLLACAAQARRAGTSDNRTVLSSEEMLKAGFPDVFTTVQSLRPQWLQRRGRTSFRNSEEVKVYLDGSLMGGPDHLKQITTRSISSVRYLDGLEASQRWGFDHGMGAIMVITRR